MRSILILVVVLAALESAWAEVELSMGDMVAEQGEVITVPVAISDVFNLNTVSLELHYDPSIVEVVSVIPGELMKKESSIVTNIMNEMGYSAFIIDLPAGSWTSGSGNLAYVSLRARGGAGKESSLELMPLRGVALVDSLGNPIESKISSGVLRIVAAQPGQDRIVVLANSVDSPLAGELFRHLGAGPVVVLHISADRFDDYRSSNMIILGGPDAYEGVGAVVQSLLGKEDADFLRQDGNRKMFLIEYTNQKIYIFGGSTRYQTREVWMENLEGIKW